MTIAVLKPDHLGDLVLSSPAIRALAQAHPDLVLFVGQRCVELARALFPNVAVQIFNLPHLTKEGESNGAPASLSHFDAVAILRHDGVITPSWASLRTRCYVMPVDNQGDHQTVLDYGVAREFVAPYDIDQLFYGARRDSVKQKAAIDPVQVGLAIGSGFYANSWPLVHWIELGRRLKVDGRRVKIVHGPAECAAAAILMSEIGLEAGDRVEGGGISTPSSIESARWTSLLLRMVGPPTSVHSLRRSFQYLGPVHCNVTLLLGRGTGC